MTTTTTPARWFLFSLPGTDGRPVSNAWAAREAGSDMVRIAFSDDVGFGVVRVHRDDVRAAGARVLGEDNTEETVARLNRAVDLYDVAVSEQAAARAVLSGRASGSARGEAINRRMRAEVRYLRAAERFNNVFGPTSVRGALVVGARVAA